MRFTKREAKKAGKATVILVLVYFILLTMGVAPFGVTFKGATNDVYFPEWATLTCGNPGADPIPDKQFISSDVEAWSLVPLPGAVYIVRTTKPIECGHIGGCQLRPVGEPTFTGQCGYTSYASYPYPEVTGKDDVFPAGTELGYFTCSGVNPGMRLNFQKYFLSPRVLEVKSGSSYVQVGTPEHLWNTYDCVVSKIDSSYRNELLQSNPDGKLLSFIDSDGDLQTKTFNTIRPDDQILPGQDRTYVAKWSPTGAQLLDYNGQELACISNQGVYHIDSVSTDSGTYKYLGRVSTQFGTGTSVCCSNSIDECGSNKYCDADTLSCKVGSPEGKSCMGFTGSKLVCDWEAKTYGYSACKDGEWVVEDKKTAKCCDGVGICDTDQYCDPAVGCIDKSYQKQLSSGVCAVDGETPTGVKVTRDPYSEYEAQECPRSETCCYESTTSPTGDCLATCEKGAVQTTSGVPFPDVDLGFGLALEAWILIIVAIFLVLILIFAMMG